MNRHSIVGMSLLLLVTGGTSAPVGPAAAAAPLPPDDRMGVIVLDGFASGSGMGVDPSFDLYVFRDGVLSQLTHNEIDENGVIPSSESPSLSPDGQRIAYVRCEYAAWVPGPSNASAQPRSRSFNTLCAPHVMNLDGSGDVLIDSDDATGLTDLDWGPAGEIAFVGRDDNVWAVSPGGATRQITHTGGAQDPTWSGDGSRIVFERSPVDEYGDPTYEPTDIWSIGSDGTGLTNLTNTPDTYESSPVWSPDGAQIMYHGEDEYTNDVVFIINADGGGRAKVSTGSEFFRDIWPGAWSLSSNYLMILTEGVDDVHRVGYVRPTGTAGVTQIFTSPPGSEALDWHGDANGDPVAYDQSFTLRADDSLAFTLTGKDPDGDPLGFTVSAPPAHGVLTGTAPDLTFRPDADYVGADKLEFTVTAGGVVSAPATVRFNVLDPEEKADLRAGITGWKSSSRTGTTDRVTATVTNAGPDTAEGVELRFGTPKGTFYTKLVKPPTPWTCTYTTLTLIKCKGPSLAPGSSASLSVDLFATTKTARTKLAVRVLSATADPDAANNTAVDYQRIRYGTPGTTRKTTRTPPMFRGASASSSRRATGEYKNRAWPAWYSVDAKDRRFWVFANNMSCQRGNGMDDGGYVTATLWIWEVGNSRTVRFEMENKVQGEAGSLFTGPGRRKTTSATIPDDSVSYKHSLTAAWPRGGFDSYKITGEWKFIRKGLSRNKKFKWTVIQGC